MIKTKIIAQKSVPLIQNFIKKKKINELTVFVEKIFEKKLSQKGKKNLCKVNKNQKVYKY